MEFQIYSLPNWITATIVGSMALGIFLLGGRRSSARLFVSMSVIYTIWVVIIAITVATKDHDTHLYLVRFCYFLETILASTFVLFSYSYPYEKRIDKRLLITLLISEAIFIYTIILDDRTIVDSINIPAVDYRGWSYGPFICIFDLYFVACWLSGIWSFASKRNGTKDELTRSNLNLMMMAPVVGVIPPTILTIIFPQIGIFGYYWLGPLLGLACIPMIMYSVCRYHLFNIRVSATEILTFMLWVFILLRIFFTKTGNETLIECGILTIAVVIGTIVIRGAIMEIKQRERIERLVGDLESLNLLLSQKVEEQTADVRKAYELERRARHDLERLNEAKDQFIMLTQHHLQAPVTRINNDLESLLIGKRGTVRSRIRRSLVEMSRSVSRLTKIVDDFLNITTLKSGGSILNVSTSTMRILLVDVLSELKIDIDSMRLTIDYPSIESVWPKLDIDTSKIREVLLIIIENAVKYNVTGGKISISNMSSTKGNIDTFEMTVRNTGVGMTREDRERLFDRHYFRSNRARTANPLGMGIGLSVARTIVRAHHGELMIESEGEDRGAMVKVILPMTQILDRPTTNSICQRAQKPLSVSPV